jgi:hypothetical protein
MTYQDGRPQDPFYDRIGRFEIMAVEAGGYCVYESDYPLAGPFSTMAEALQRARAEDERLRRKPQ